MTTCLKSILITDKDSSVRVAALTVIAALFKALNNDTIKVTIHDHVASLSLPPSLSLSLSQVLGDCLLDLYRLVKYVKSTDHDPLVQTTVGSALEELSTSMKEAMLEKPTLTKKITVLDPIVS